MSIHKHIVIVLGYFKAGKSEIGKILQKHRQVPVLHPIADVKDFLKEHYDRLYVDLDTPEGKSERVHTLVDSPITFNDVLVGMFKFFITEGLDPHFLIPYLYREGNEFLKSDRCFSSTAIRNVNELTLMERIAKEQSAKLIIFEAISDRSVPEVSDIQVPELVARGRQLCDQFKVIENNGTKQDLTIAVLEVYDKAIARM
jgi:hypothetical protein